MKFVVEYPKGSTPLDANEISGLIPDYITTRAELNRLEKDNIGSAVKATIRRPQKNLLSIGCCYKLHFLMLGESMEVGGNPTKVG